MKNKLRRILEPSAGLYLAALALACIVTIVLKQYYLAAGEAVLLLALILYQSSLQNRRKHEIAQYVKSATGTLMGATQDMIVLPFPMALIKISTHEILWNNEAFQEIAGTEDSLFERQIHELFPGFSTSWLAEGSYELPGEVQSGGKRYHVLGTLIRSDTGDDPVLMGMTFWLDDTDHLNIKDEYARSRPIMVTILIDNYDELTANLSDSAVSSLNAELGEKISLWCDNFSGLLRKLERNRFLFVFEARNLSAMLEDKFSLLDSIRTVSSPSGIYATASIGVGKDAGSFPELFDYSNLAIEMSLSRGGDQAVVKDNYNFTFYGGRNNEAERHTKVKSRVMAGSLRELIRQSSSVFVVGHRNSDIDAIGAAVGVLCLCRKLGKKASIVADLQNTLAGPLIATMQEMPEYENAFLTEQDALLQADPRSLLVVVDTNRPDQVDARGLLDSIERIVVIDHHRRAADYIEHVALNLHEPYASSASELTTELLQYTVDPQDLKPMEASALLSGIALDTKNFTIRTGSRTFEAAAFLRRCGADTVVVKKMFQNDLGSTLERYRILQSARLYRKQIAIAALEEAADRAIASQAADELLTITGITASFVVYPLDGMVYISARSIGDANVQMILEPLGGGGNAATAGAQVSDKSVREVLGDLVASIDKFYDK
ncbi:MAG: DHH family phosphoesterase [Oscillospiraceae bacterium]|nr:DHH family phosphoesterase [Oscillospiraceae bacterium]